jgi:hypothetical protein
MELAKSLIHNPILRRWIDILFLTGSAMIICLMLRAPFEKVLLQVYPYLGSLHYLVWSAFISFIFAILTVNLIRLGTLNVKFRIRTIIRYPPCWVSSFFVLILFVLWLVFDSGGISLVHLTQILSQLSTDIFAIFLGVFLGFSYNSLELQRASPQPLRESTPDHESSNHNIFDNDTDLISWITEEKPIQHPNQDMFERALPAYRVAKLLCGKKVASIGIVGPYGSGKSSFVNLVEYYLIRHPKTEQNSDQSELFSGEFILCRVEGWGRVSGTVAQIILYSAIEELRLHVDCTSIITLPENYRKAIAGTVSIGGAAISALLQNSQDPLTQLCRLDNILMAANMRLIIVMEDLDRNVDDSIIREEIPALLDRLRILSNVSFLLAIGVDRHLSDILLRICDDIEAIS